MASHPAVQELDALLQSLQSLKPPGVNKTKVESATKICMELQNIPVEPYFVDSMVSAFQKSPNSHKLGVLYIVDSIMRQWVVSGPTHAGGVRRMTDNMPALINPYLPAVPEAQKERLSKLFDIWLSSKTFPTAMLAGFKNRLAHPNQQQPPTTAGAAAPVDQASLLAALAAPPHQPAPVPQPAIVPQAPQAPQLSNNNAASVLALLAGQTQPSAITQVTGNGVPAQYAQHVPVNYQSQSTPVAAQQPYSASPQPANPLAGLASLMQAGAQDPNALAQQIQILQALSAQLGPEALGQLLGALGAQQQAPTAAQAPPAYLQAPVGSAPQQIVAPYPANGGHVSQNGQGYGRDDTGPGARERSRSPDWNHRRFSPPHRRDSPTYGAYDPSAPSGSGRGQDDRGRRGRGRGGASFRNDYRQRSPPPPARDARDSPVPRSTQPKPIAYDNKLREGYIKVLSRTLFVGGVRTSEAELKNFFRQFGGVQSCIVNHEKRHAFLKLVSHQDAMATRQAVWNLPESEYRSLFERVNWAVGFGPTHCADYNIGVSEIPIDLLTDADQKWMLTAEYGGTGGKTITPGMVVEEPDIEIGAGPSSKAIHRRGGGGGGRGESRGGNSFGRRGGASAPDNNQGRFRQNRPEPPAHPEPNTIGPPPAVPTFGAPIPGFPLNFGR